ncbi:heavy metal sensor signal transduction histidine kinase [Caballeronia arationis]|jgi:two-component system heavy metal sensor histidine kinase CusS|uniref:Sensor protein n=1 Tax=Caballeronia arationis TaxID=1777142 RepID=A0A7Z7ICD2_9BURK|nr:heavy metal sensor histidine kinase [Caballeronia arationis]SAK72572.1 heavy metal sensor signal transduction histidine kinase [Caballeronia arationis]SOE88140.1 heavy metal sensor kinase [Caballeronia arationis]
MKRSISRRLAAMFAVVALFVFTLVGTGLFLVLRSQLENHLRESLDTRAEIARLIVLHASTPEKWKMAKEKLADITPRDSSTLFAASSEDPRFTYGTPLTGSVRKQIPGGYVRLRPNGRAYDMLTTAVTIPANGERPPLQLQVSIDCSPNVRTMRVFGFALTALTALGTITVLLLSYSVARIGLAPLTRLTKDASNVRPNNRSQRLNTRSLPHELEDLAKSFNGALERLDSAYARLESFNADVAHELRTPVTILIGQTEVALTRDRSISELRHTLQSNLEEFERVRAIINDMLFLARADQGERATGLVEVSLAGEVTRTLEFLEIPLEEAQVRAVSKGDARAFINTSLFGRALSNLVMNAIQHCAPGATISVSIAREPGRISIAVSNPGEPIEPSMLDHLFDRFYRAESSRTNSRENHGLGLAIVKAVAEMHRGTVSATSVRGINTFAFSVARFGAEERPSGPPPASPSQATTTGASAGAGMRHRSVG